MKKGLLGLLALALTVVGCQNYDDQFAELTSQISDLQSTVDGLTGVSTAISNLQSTVSGLSSALSGIQTSVNGLSNYDDSSVVAQLGTISQTLSDLAASLAGVATAGDLGAISSTLADVQADVRELLEANAVINQNVVINNSATLDYAETLIATGDDDPNVIINGYVRITTTNLTDAEVTRANAIAVKLATILGDTSASTAVGREALTVTGDEEMTFTNLAFIDGDYVVDGSDQDDAALRTVSGNLGVDHGGVAGPINYSQVTSVGGDVAIDASDAATATAINFSGTDISGNIHHGAGSALDFPGALSIDLGAASFNSLTAQKATSIISAMSAATTNVIIDAQNGGTIDFNSLLTVGGNFGLTGTSTTTFHADAMTGVTGTVVVTSTGEAHFPALTSMDDADINASTAVALTSLVTLTNTLDLNTTPAAIFTALAAIEDNLSWDVGVINLPNAVVGAGDIISGVATNVTVAAFPAITDLPTPTTHLTATAQDVDVTATADVTNLTITAADGSDVDYTAGGTVEHVVLNGTTLNSFPAGSTSLISVVLNNTSTNTIAGASTVATVTLQGTILSFDSEGTSVAEINNTANFKDIPGTTTGETPITFILKNTPNIETLDLSSMSKVAVVEVTGNTALTEVIAPGTSPLLTANAGASYTIKTNSIVGTYTGATAAYPGDGVNPPTPYAAACLELPGLSTWPAYIADIQTTNPAAAFTFDYKSGTNADYYGEDIVADTAQTHVTTPTNTSEIDTDASLALIQATACN